MHAFHLFRLVGYNHDVSRAGVLGWGGFVIQRDPNQQTSSPHRRPWSTSPIHLRFNLTQGQRCLLGWDEITQQCWRTSWFQISLGSPRNIYIRADLCLLHGMFPWAVQTWNADSGGNAVFTIRAARAGFSRSLIADDYHLVYISCLCWCRPKVLFPSRRYRPQNKQDLLYSLLTAATSVYMDIPSPVIEEHSITLRQDHWLHFTSFS